MIQLMVLYPQPTDAQKFENDYIKHIAMLHEKTGIPDSEKPYTVTKFLPGPGGISPYYQMFTMPFESPEALDAMMSSTGMQEVAADASRISTGGPIVILFGDTN